MTNWGRYTKVNELMTIGITDRAYLNLGEEVGGHNILLVGTQYNRSNLRWWQRYLKQLRCYFLNNRAELVINANSDPTWIKAPKSGVR